MWFFRTILFAKLLYLPVLITRSTISVLPAFVARWRQVCPCFVLMAILAPLSIRYLQISSYPRLMAMWRAVIPWWSAASTSKFFVVSSRSMIFLCPNCAANWSAVAPLEVDVASGLAPFFSKISTASRASYLHDKQFIIWLSPQAGQFSKIV